MTKSYSSPFDDALAPLWTEEAAPTQAVAPVEPAAAPLVHQVPDEDPLLIDAVDHPVPTTDGDPWWATALGTELGAVPAEGDAPLSDDELYGPGFLDLENQLLDHADEVRAEIAAVREAVPGSHMDLFDAVDMDVLVEAWSLHLATERARDTADRGEDATSDVMDAWAALSDLSKAISDAEGLLARWSKVAACGLLTVLSALTQARMDQARGFPERCFAAISELQSIEAAIAEAPDDIAEAFLQLEINASLAAGVVGLSTIAPPIGVVAGIGAAVVSAVLDRVLGPSSGGWSDAAAGTSGVSAALGYAPKLQKASTGLGIASAGVSTVLDTMELHQAVEIYKSLPDRLRAAARTLEQLAAEYEKLEPILRDLDAAQKLADAIAAGAEACG